MDKTYPTNNKPLIKGVSLAIFLSTLGVGAFAFAFPLIAQEKNVAGSWLGAAFSGYFFAKLVLAPLSGAWADKKGVRRLMLLASFWGLLLPPVYIFKPTIFSLYFIQFNLGLVTGIIKPLGMVIVGCHSSNVKVGRNFGWINGFFYAALMLSPVAGGILFQQHCILPVLWFLEACLLLTFAILYFCLPKGPIPVKSNQGVRSRKNRPQNAIDLWLLMLAVIGRTAGIAVTLSFWPVLLTHKLSWSSTHIGALVAIPGIITCVGLPLTGQLADRWNKRLLTFSGMFICAAALFYMPLTHNAIGIISLSTLLGLGSLLSIPASMSLASGLSRRQGRAMGFFHSASNLGFIIGPLIGGLGASLWGPGGAFVFIGAIGMVASIPIGIKCLTIRQRSKHFHFRLATTATVFLLVATLSLKLFYPVEIVAKESFRFADVAMGTVVRLNLVAKDHATASRAAAKGFAEIKRMENDFDHRGDGSIGQVNAAAGVQPVKVTPDAYRLIERALQYAANTHGIFDVTIGAVSVETEYYAAEIEPAAKDLVDYRQVRLDSDARSVFLPKQGMALDLDGMAKGTIIDSVTETLKKEGITAGIVEAGGDFYCFGDKNWHVGIQHPRKEALLEVISVQDQGVCGSGDYYQFVIDETDDQNPWHHHILHPDQLLSANKSVSVTVLADSAEQADVLATALFIMGPDQGKSFLNKKYPTVAALWVRPDLGLSKTDNFPMPPSATAALSAIK